MNSKSFKFMRVKPEVHQLIKVEATRQGKTINELLETEFKQQFETSKIRPKKNDNKKFKFNW